MAIKAKPFVKWAGGKRKLLDILESQLPNDFDNQDDVTYVEPFVGGGAMLFHMISNHANITKVIINDINCDLMRCYNLVKFSPLILIRKLQFLEEAFLKCDDDEKRKKFYLKARYDYNFSSLSKDDRAAYFMFLNRTCFNGLYRENLKGEFNVPFGQYKRPNICNEELIMEDHKLLQKVDILCGNYSAVLKSLGDGYKFIYFDPPYRPLRDACNFVSYSKSKFGDQQQEHLKEFCDILSEQGCYFMLSNSSSANNDGSSYFEKLYEGYFFNTIYASRFINAYARTRVKQAEILIRNYDNVKLLL